jgi:hypothetical protein
LKASELIENLNRLISEHGDLEVYTEYDSMSSDTHSVTVHLFEKERPHWFRGPFDKKTPLKSDETHGIVIW